MTLIPEKRRLFLNISLLTLKNNNMNNLRNSVRLIGNLGGTPEIKELSGGKKLAKISIATTEKYKDSDGKQVSETQWHNLVVWGKQAEFVEKYLEKGNEVAVEGKLLNRSYTDKEGHKKYISEISVNEIMKVGSPRKKDQD
jgi:single-strand DNA-binding protein